MGLFGFLFVFGCVFWTLAANRQGLDAQKYKKCPFPKQWGKAAQELDKLPTRSFGIMNKVKSNKLATKTVTQKRAYIKQLVEDLLDKCDGISFKGSDGHHSRRHVFQTCRRLAGGPVSGKNLYRLLQRLRARASLKCFRPYVFVNSQSQYPQW